MDPIKLAWVPQKSDYAQAFFVRMKVRGTIIRFVLMFVVLWILLIGYFIGIANMNVISTMIIVAGATVFCAGTMAFILVMSIHKFWRRNPKLHAPATAQITDRGIRPEKIAANGVVTWSQIDRVLETKNGYVVEIADTDPKRFFLLAKRGVDEQRSVDLREALNAHVPS